MERSNRCDPDTGALGCPRPFMQNQDFQIQADVPKKWGSDTDLVAAAVDDRKGGKALWIATAYLPYEKYIGDSNLFCMAREAHNAGASLVIGCHSNTHHTVWGSSDTNERGLPPHILQLTAGAPIIMLRNINQPKFRNGTRLAVKKLTTNGIEATILNGKFKGGHVLIPRIPMIPTDMPFEFKRLKFPVRLPFTMTIIKAQRQSLQGCGLNLENNCFSHGQLYVACSHVSKPADLFVYAHDGKTKNVVYHRALQ